jgi:hypothetical protein
MKYIGLPRPSYPLGATKERTYFGSCNLEIKKEWIVGFCPDEEKNVFLTLADIRL